MLYPLLAYYFRFILTKFNHSKSNVYISMRDDFELNNIESVLVYAAFR
jgi:hypothetical protein